jgi:hypothetical protein
VQETKVLNIYRNYLFTTQENQLLAFDSFQVITSFEKLTNFRCRREIVHINQRLANVYITIIGQLNGN